MVVMMILTILLLIWFDLKRARSSFDFCMALSLVTYLTDMSLS